MTTTNAPVELNSGESTFGLSNARDRWTLSVRGAGAPILVTTGPALLSPVLDGVPAVLTLDAVETSGPLGLTLRFVGEAVEQFVLRIDAASGDEAIDLYSEFIPRRDGQLNRLTLFPQGTMVSAYDLVNFRNRHFTPHTWPELNLGQSFETDTYSGDWQFAPHPSLFVFRKLAVNLFAGLFEVPYGAFGMYLSVDHYRVRHWFLDYGTPPNGLALKAGETFRSPRLRLFAQTGKTVYDTLDAFSGMLIRAGQTPDPAAKQRPAWWTEPLYCTWGDQVYKSGTLPAVDLQAQSLKPEFRPGAMLNEAFVREAAAVILRERLPIRTMLIDEGWHVARGQWEPHPRRFPDLRGLVDDLHRQGFKVVVWLAWPEVFDDACVPAEFLVGGGQWRNRHGRRFTDYSSSHTHKHYVAPLMRRLFSGEPGCYDLDGFKTDFQADKIHPEMPLANPAWRGEENYLCRVTKLFHREMKGHKPDAMHVGCAGHFWLAPWMDINRTYDVHSSNYLEHERRGKMLRHTAPGCPVSYDLHGFRENLEGWFDSARHCGAAVEIGNLLYVKDDPFSEARPADASYYERLRIALAGPQFMTSSGLRKPRGFSCLGGIVLTALLVLVTLFAADCSAQSIFQPAFAKSDIDFVATAEFPGNSTPSSARADELCGYLRLQTPPKWGGWTTAETDGARRYLRLAFQHPVAIGTIVGGGGQVCFLRATATYPGNIEDDTQWEPVPVPAGQAGLWVVPFPTNVLTRALRWSFEETTHGTKTRSGFGGALILKARLHNLTPEGVAFASSQISGADNVVEANRASNLITGGKWGAAPTEDISPEHPQWALIAWPEPRTLVGLGIVNPFALRIETDLLSTGYDGAPALAPESAWTHANGMNNPVWWRPAYADFYLPFVSCQTTRAVRVRITQPLTNENSDIATHTGGKRRSAELGGVLAFTDFGERAVPPRPQAQAEPPPIRISYTMPYAGKAALAIGDDQGRRLRNLFAEEDRMAGAQVAAWDGKDDAGRFVPPGSYAWKLITHEPLHLTYQGTVNVSGDPPWWKANVWDGQLGAGNWLSDHVPPSDVTCIGDRVFIGAELAECGHTILAADLHGRKLWGTKWLETAGARFVANDGRKVYALGEGGWIGDRTMIHEIDPLTFPWRRVMQLVFDPAHGMTGGASGLAARDGKLYVAFNHPPLPWLQSILSEEDLDRAHSSPGPEDLAALLRMRPDVARSQWSTGPSAAAEQHLRLAFKTQQAIGAVLTPAATEVSALRADAAFPGDVTHDTDWLPFTATISGAFRACTAPPHLQTRALRFTFRRGEPGNKPWEARLPGAIVLAHRLDDITADAKATASAGVVRPAGNWDATAAQAITPDHPAMLTLSWPAPQTFRGVAFLGLGVKRAVIDIQTSDDIWQTIGEITPPIRWRPMYADDYFDAGSNLTTRAIRLRVLEPLTTENPDIADWTGKQRTHARLSGLTILRALGDDPEKAAWPSQRISIINAADGAWERHIAVPSPAWPTFNPQGNLVLIADKQIVRLSLTDGTRTPVLMDKLDDPRGLAFDAAGNLYVADGKANQVRVFTPEGKPLRTIGDPGGRTVGPYDPRRMQNPRGIAIDATGQLWVAEAGYQPKRTSLWSLSGELLNQFIGPALYGGGGYIDPHNKSRFYYEGMEFAFNWKTGDWKVKQILTLGPRMDHPVYFNGRQYMVGDPFGLSKTPLLIGEFRKDRIVPLAAMGNAELWPPLSTDPALRALAGTNAWDQLSFAWADANGDGIPQPEEVWVGPPGLRLDSTYWPARVNDKLEMVLGGRLLKPAGFTKCGAPIYKPAETPAMTNFPSENIYAMAVDKQGRVLVNGRPVLAACTDGHADWTYPQKWVGVHDSRIAPAPKPGQLIGGLGFIGQVDIPKLGETFLLSGNKGEWYLFTTDGMLVATLWHDYRTPGVLNWNFPEARRGMSLDDVTLGEEHFGGSFTRADDGHYYLVAGPNHNSIVELRGLDTCQRQSGQLDVTTQLLAAAQDWVRRQAVAGAQQREVPKVVDVSRPSAPIIPDGKLGEWDPKLFVPIGNRGALAIAADATNLYLAFRVDKGGPLRNGGDDPNMLFKTGDSVDFQIGADASADPRRLGPVPGDQRLLVTIFKGKPIGVLYNYRVPNTPATERTPFSSPWRTEYVDKIERLDASLIGIAITPKGYTVEIVVPLARLGLKPAGDRTFKADFGILSADSTGMGTQVRTYWANPDTGVVSDVPSEIKLTPGLWGDLRMQSKNQ